MLGSVFRLAAPLAIVLTGTAAAQKYDPGASDTEVKLGQTVPFSGPVSVAGATGHASLAYFAALNKAGGINGRRIKLIVLDDGYTPPKTLEATRRLVGAPGAHVHPVEQEHHPLQGSGPGTGFRGSGTA